MVTLAVCAEIERVRRIEGNPIEVLRRAAPHLTAR
jgi:hypothetical protein